MSRRFTENFTLHVWMNHFIATAAIVATKGINELFWDR
jgi:hypothetical protein